MYKNRLISHLIESPDVCQLLLNISEYDPSEVENLVYTQIFPYLYVDETQTVVLPYLCIEVDIPRIPTNAIKDMNIIVWVYCHKDGMKYSKEGFIGTKVDILGDMVERLLSDSDAFGIGKLHLNSVTYMNSGNSKYYGKQLLFSCPDFKRKR